jgi:hypothetical protein
VRNAINTAVMVVGLCLLPLGVALSAVTTATATTYALRPCSTCREVSFPTEAQCREAAQAEARLAGETRTTGSAVYTCITRHNVVATFRANPAPVPVNCVVSAWGAWSDPAWSACSGGQQTRTLTRSRTVVTQPSNGGTACPALTEPRNETRPCAPAPTVLSWSHDGANTQGFRINYGTSATALTQTIQIANATARTYTMTSLAPGTYYFAVRAYNGGEQSDASNVVSKTVR